MVKQGKNNLNIKTDQQGNLQLPFFQENAIKRIKKYRQYQLYLLLECYKRVIAFS